MSFFKGLFLFASMYIMKFWLIIPDLHSNRVRFNFWGAAILVLLFILYVATDSEQNSSD